VWKTQCEKVESDKFQTGFHRVFHSVLKLWLKNNSGNCWIFPVPADRFPLFPTDPVSPVSTVLKKSRLGFHKIFPIFSLSTPQFFHNYTSGNHAGRDSTSPLFLRIRAVDFVIPIFSGKNRVSTFSTPSTTTTILLF
jgi:hypothetical protein